MLAAIRDAQKSTTFETYIYWSGDIGKKFSEELCERAKAGVKVNVLLDAVGTGKIETKYLDDLKASGVEVERYHPLRWYSVARINNRTHRKLLVVDGRVGLTGGVGISDRPRAIQGPLARFPSIGSKAPLWHLRRRLCRRASEGESTPTSSSRAR